MHPHGGMWLVAGPFLERLLDVLYLHLLASTKPALVALQAEVRMSVNTCMRSQTALSWAPQPASLYPSPCLHMQVAVSLAEQIVALQEWQLATSLLCLCAEALAADPARSNSSVDPSFTATADCADAAVSQNGVLDSVVAARPVETRRRHRPVNGAADVATRPWHHRHNMDKGLHALSGVVLAVALLDRLTACVKLAERRAGSSQRRPTRVVPSFVQRGVTVMWAGAPLWYYQLTLILPSTSSIMAWLRMRWILLR